MVTVPDRSMALVEAARKGITKEACDWLAKQLGLTMREMAFVMNLSERTLHRYAPQVRLNTAASHRILQLARLYEYGQSVFEDMEKFKRWMRRPHHLFNGQLPLELLDTDTGFRLVEDELGRMEHGIFA
jgi:putative toxin-antitoxin system antitoxin component (TIGR02293 family)